MKTILDIPNIENNTIMYYLSKNGYYKVRFNVLYRKELKGRNYTFKNSLKGSYIVYNDKRYYYPYNNGVIIRGY